MNSLLCFLFAAEGFEALALQVEDVLLAHGSAGGDVAAAEDFGDLSTQLYFVVGDEVALAHEVDAPLERCEETFAGGRNICAGDWGFVSGAGQFQGAGFGVGEDALAIHGNAVGVGEESEAARLVR